MLRTRREILSMLHSSAFTTGIHLLSEGPSHSHRITIESTRHYKQHQEQEDKEEEPQPQRFRAVLLIRSSEWYKYRLNVFGELQGIELIVCAKHDSCLPIPVWSVEEARVYQPGETAIPLSDLLARKVRGTKYGSLLLVAALLSSKQEALDLLKQFPRSTRYRYEAKVRCYANLKRGGKLNIL